MKKVHACHECRHLVPWTEHGDALAVGPVEDPPWCRERPGIENLRQFPFIATKCEYWQANNRRNP